MYVKDFGGEDFERHDDKGWEKGCVLLATVVLLGYPFSHLKGR